MPEITDDPAPLADIIRAYIIAVCELCHWNVTSASHVLGLSAKTVYNHLHRYEEDGFIEQVQVGELVKRTRWQRRTAA